MKAGTIIIGSMSTDPGVREVVERCAAYAASVGHRNVRTAYHSGKPSSYDVMKSMFLDDGIDTFCILPVVIAEGNLSIWLMPKKLTLPDNSGSWTMIGDRDVATRFSTAMGRDPVIAEAIVAEVGDPGKDSGMIIIARGSKLSQSWKTAEYYANRLRDAGWDVECAYLHHGRTVDEAVSALMEGGCSRVSVVPLLVSTSSERYAEAIRTISESFESVNICRPVSMFPEFVKQMESKIPEDW